MRYPVLYSFRRCPYAIRARYALIYSRFQCFVHEVNLSEKPADMIALSDKATVPVLHLPSGEVIDESLDIVSYALSQSDPESMTIVTEKERSLFNDWVGEWQDKWVIAINIYKYSDRYPEKNKETACHQLISLLHIVENALCENGCLIRESCTVADIALFPLIRQFAIIDWDAFCQLDIPLTVDWLKTFIKNNFFENTMLKHSEREYMLF